MKTQLTTSYLNEITKAYLMRLTGEVPETLARDVNFSKPVQEISPCSSRMLSAADVWNIQRNKRIRVQRRFSF
ncbi:MAG: hypothetical protein ABJB86_20765 [Bacteroidota bacterium]